MPCGLTCQGRLQTPFAPVINNQVSPCTPAVHLRPLLASRQQSTFKSERRHTRLHARRQDSPLVTPVIPVGEDGQEVTDMFTHLLRNRIIFVGGRINDEVATSIVASMLALEAIDETQDIQLYINSQGGSPYALIAILDVMNAIKCDVSTVAFGLVATTATLLLAAGTKGKRYAMPNTRIMMHQPSGGAMGSAFDVTIQATELNRTMQVVNAFFNKFTQMSIEEVEEETDRDNFLSPMTAIEKGLIDRVLER